MNRLRRSLRDVRSDDTGFGMILVIGTSILVFSLVLAATAYAISGLKQSRNRTTFEQSLAVAEQGIDGTMSNLQTAFNKYNVDYPVPNNAWAYGTPAAPSCNLAPVGWPAVLANGTTVSDSSGTFVAASGRTAEQNEKQWSTEQLTTIAATTSCRVTDTSGNDRSQYVVLKPVTTLVGGLYPKFGKIYTLSAIPSFDDSTSRRRLLKSEYLFMPYRPQHAILTGSNLTFQGDLLVTGAAGVDPLLAAVHANGTIDVIGNSNVVTGPVTSTGVSSTSTSSGPISQGPSVSIPSVSALDFHGRAQAASPTSMTDWYDMCDGVLKTYAVSAPCTGTAIAGTRNWSWSAGTRTWTAPASVLPGTYYANEANVKNGSGNGTISNLTVVASSTNPTNCGSKRYGNIDWDHYDISNPQYQNLWFYADGDVSVTSNIKIGQGATTGTVVSGMIVAGDQTRLYTQSNSAVGGVVSADTCRTSPQPADSLISTNEVHSDLYYDPNAVAPFTSVITNTLWLDYSN